MLGRSDVGEDASTTESQVEALENLDCVLYANVGGRPANIAQADGGALRTARPHRYQLDDGDGPGETALLEAEVATWQGSTRCLADACGGQAIRLALRASGAKHGDPILTNALTLAPVPGSIRAVGANPVLVETTSDLAIDLADLEEKTKKSGTQILLLSLMRGHLLDMDAIMDVANRIDLSVIEDCARVIDTSKHRLFMAHRKLCEVPFSAQKARFYSFLRVLNEQWLPDAMFF